MIIESMISKLSKIFGFHSAVNFIVQCLKLVYVTIPGDGKENGEDGKDFGYT